MKKHLKILLDLDMHRASGRDILAGIARYASLHGPWEFILSSPGYYTGDLYPDKVKEFWFEKLEFDAAIKRGIHGIDLLRKNNIPTVISSFCKESIDMDIPQIRTNSSAISVMAANHLIDCGLNNFAFCGFDSMDWSNDRKQYFVDHLNSLGKHCHLYPSPQPQKNLTWKDEKQHLINWIEGLPKPIGIMGCNDDRCFQIAEACKNAEIAVPYEVAIIGVDNDEMLCKLAWPNLTSVSINFERAGFEAAQAIDQMLSGKELKNTIISVEPLNVASRPSTDILTIEDISIRNAIRFIRDNFKSDLGVEQIADAAGLTRRVLETRFRNILNTTIHNELQKYRMNHIAQLLVTTNYTIKEIASSLEFTDPEHISRDFKNYMKLSPTGYRKKYSSQTT